MAFANLPPFAAWRHIEARDGFEVVFLRVEEDGFRFEGRTVATESGQAWSVDYEIELSPEWLTRRARISSRTVGVDGTMSCWKGTARVGGWSTVYLLPV